MRENNVIYIYTLSDPKQSYETRKKIMNTNEK